jgi:hypothetical protein
MMEQPLFWIIVLMVLWGAWYIVRHFLTPTARLERKRRKNHNPVVAKAKRPMVLFSVKTPKN